MALSPFENLPVELFEAINVHVSLQDLCNVRLASRSMALHATQSYFGSFLRSRCVEMTRPALESMADLTAKGRIGCFVEELTLAGVVYNTAGLHHQLQMGTKTMLGRGCEGSGMLDEPKEQATVAELSHVATALDRMRETHVDYVQFHESGDDVTLLTAVLENLASNTKRRGLASLKLDVAEYRQDTETTQPAFNRLAWRSVWHMAEQTFQIFAVALGAARLPIQELNFFCNDFSGHCSLQCHQLSRCEWETSGVIFALASVESLSISLSDRVLNETAHDALATGDPVERKVPTPDADELTSSLGELKKQAAEVENFSGLVTLLNSCKRLRRLELRRCYVRQRHPELRDYQGEKFIQYLAGIARLGNLEIVSLGNFVTRKQDLLGILQQHPICDLMFVNTSLYSGAWNEIFEHCTANMHALHSEDLSQGCREMLFGDYHPDIEDSLLKGLRKSQNTHIRHCNDPEKPIVWRIPRYRRLGPDPVVHRRLKRVRNMFGPPASHYPGLHH